MTVITYIDEDQVQANREVLQQWLSANSIDPHLVPLARWISIERDGRGPASIRFGVFKRDQDGRKLLDPDNANQAWTEERTSPLMVPLPPLAATSPPPSGNPV